MSGIDASASPGVVLVLDAETRPALAVARSAGRRGYRVVAATHLPGAPALYSRYVSERISLPSPSADFPGYESALAELISSLDSPFVFVSSDHSLAALRRRREQFHQARIALPDERSLAQAIDKVSTLAAAERVGVPIPESIVVTRADEIRAAAASVGFPCVVKPSQSWLIEDGVRARRVTSVFLRNSHDDEHRAHAFVSPDHPALVQEFVPGRQEELAIFRCQNTLVAIFAHTASRSFPPLGGASVMRTAVVPATDVIEFSDILLSELAFEGYAELEYRRDANGQARLMEINPRLPGSFEFSLRAGVDFVGLQLDWLAGLPTAGDNSYIPGMKMSWPRGELAYLLAAVRRRPAPAPGMHAVARAVFDYMPPPTIDSLDLRDLRPTFVTLARLLTAPMRRF
jgi:predicted ATP-grasp superfamily ATP-dependent carboligase